MNKTTIYCMPGLAAGAEIFDNLNFDQNRFIIKYLGWKNPLSIDESLANYALRMCTEINEKNPILIGVSFGGILVQEMSKLIKCKKVIIISSVKQSKELPENFLFAKKTGLYKLFPTYFITNFDKFAPLFIGSFLKKKAEMYSKYLAYRNGLYLRWSIYNVLNWQQEKPLKDIVHIHGTDDHIFSIKNITNYYGIEKGTHSMVLLKAREISKIIDSVLTF